MIPYTSFLYFGILLIYIVIPALIVGFFKRISKIWLVLATLVMLVIQYYVPQNITKSISVNEIALVAIYAVLQWLIAILFLMIRKRGEKPGSILPGGVIKSAAFCWRRNLSTVPS